MGAKANMVDAVRKERGLYSALGYTRRGGLYSA